MIAQDAIRWDFVAMFRTALGYTVEAGADGHSLDGIQAHHDMSNISVKAIIQGFTPAGRHVLGMHLDAGADGIAISPQLIHIRLELGNYLGVGRIKGVIRYLVPRLKRKDRKSTRMNSSP